MKTLYGVMILGALVLPSTVRAELPWQFDQHTRYIALGDSLAAGYGATPATQGYVYRLYQSGIFNRAPNTVFANAGIPGMTSQQVLQHQVPQAIQYLKDFQEQNSPPSHLTLSFGGNDLLAVFSGADPQAVLSQFAANLNAILFQLRSELPRTRIYLGNLYTVPEIPGADQLVFFFNNFILKPTADAYGVPVADVYSAFLGKRGLLLVERHGADQFQVHPTNAGHRVIAQAFEAVIR